jgi:hypothetical protein
MTYRVFRMYGSSVCALLFTREYALDKIFYALFLELS